MAVQFPICLVGETLGERHRFLNELVERHKHENFDIIRQLPEKSTIDRLFKIDLAVKIENVDYILENLKNEDMLYVSRSLKAKWLLNKQYENIINPVYLEDVLYPEMITTAVNKMKHWIHLNINDENRSQEFFTYYYDKNRKLALKFSPKCSEDFIKNKFSTIIKDITPQLLKLLCEKTPIAAKMFFEAIQNDKSVATTYDKNASQFFNSIKCILKVDSEIYLDILEHHFRNCWFQNLSSDVTQYILSKRKDKFWKKPELYTSWFLDVKTVANSLTAEECENLVLLLARSTFLDFWFNYQTVEPFIKRLDVTKRAEFKKKVFVQKDIGDKIEEWPYPLPKTYPTDDDASSVIDDNDEDHIVRPCAYALGGQLEMASQRFLKADCGYHLCKPKTELDKLFDVYRFKNFTETLYELRKNIKSASSSQNRMHVFLVLISKSGGKTEYLQDLFELLLKYSNEQLQVRAAVVRSLVKRAFIWRVNDVLWQQMLTYGHGLGLDGSQSEIDCHEGLHAVIVRNILTGVECSPAIKKAYLHMNNFSTLKDYNFTGAEKKALIDGLQKMLLPVVYEDTDLSLAAIQYLLDILEAYKVRVDSTVIDAVKHYVSKDTNIGLLKRLYDSKIGRKELHSYNFNQFTTGAACVNALKHDTTVLTPNKLLEVMKYQQLDHFFTKLSIYFGGSENLGGIFLRVLMKEKPEKKYVRPIVRLIGDELKSYILQIDSQKDDRSIKRYAASVRANAHLARPRIGLHTLEWKTAGVKFLANRIIVCKEADINKNIDNLVTWKRSAKLAVIIARRIKKEHEVFPVLVKLRPTVAFKYGLMYLKQLGTSADIRVWESFAPLITKLESSFIKHPHLQLKARKISKIPIEFRPKYISLIYPILKKLKTRYRLPPLRHMKQLLLKMDEYFIENILTEFFNNEFKVAKLWSYGFELADYEYSTLHLEILGKFMLLCKDEDTLDKRFESIALLFLHKLEPHLKAGSEFTQEAKSNFETFTSYLMYQDEGEKYVPCTTALEKIVKWMQDVMPMERNFDYYVKTHLSMLHNKAKRQCLKQFPEMFADKKQINKEAAEIMGEIFGRYIAHDANELKSRYFDSIIELYGKSLNNYLYEYKRACTTNISLGIIKGILQEGKGSERRLVMNLYLDNIITNYEDVQKAEKIIKECNDNQIIFLYNSKFTENQ